MKITKEGNELVFRFPANDQCVAANDNDEDSLGLGGCSGNPYFVGLIIPVKQQWGDEYEMGFAPTIDMCYKDKGYQHGEIQIRWYGNKEAFINKCFDLGIDVEEYQKCHNCKGPIYGCSVSSLELTKKYGGPVCSISCDK